MSRSNNVDDFHVRKVWFTVAVFFTVVPAVIISKNENIWKNFRQSCGKFNFRFPVLANIRLGNSVAPERDQEVGLEMQK